MHLDNSIVYIGILFIIKFIFGFGLFRNGKPYNAIILTMHKLTSLYTAGYIGLIARRVHINAGLNINAFVMVIVTEVCFILAIATGGFLSTDKPASAFISLIHKVTPLLSIIATILTVNLIF